MLGSRSTPYSTSKALLDFLYRDTPEDYVFRGQICEYPLPLIPSGFRDRFHPFSTGSQRGSWAGISLFDNEVRDLFLSRFQNYPLQLNIPVKPSTGITVWDLEESDYQAGFHIYFGQYASSRHKELGTILRDLTVLGLDALFGVDIGSMLGQQYGLTSIALDATTDPAIAVFFAKTSAPYYDFVDESDNLGVVYRWPRGMAMIAKDYLLSLERDSFVNCKNSFQNFIELSPDLNGGNPHYQESPSGLTRQILFIKSLGSRRDFKALAFPKGAFERSRFGRQQSALLWPEYETVKDTNNDDNNLSMGSPKARYATLVGDILFTHYGEAFFFQQSSESSILSEIDKYKLWPSLLTAPDHFQTDYVNNLPSISDSYLFEDVYLEFMLRFFSSCSPASFIVLELLKHAGPSVIPLNSGKYMRGMHLGGVIDLGFAIQPSDAETIASRLKVGAHSSSSRSANCSGVSSNINELMPPVPRYIFDNQANEFQHRFIKALKKKRQII